MSVRVCGDSVSAKHAAGLILAVATAAVLGLAGSGCNNSETTRPTAKGNNRSAPAGQRPGAATAVSQRCQTLLSSGIEMLRPENLGITAEPKAAVDTFNNWVRDCGKNGPAVDPPLNDPALEKFLPEAERHAVNAELYDRQDIEHVRNCWLFKQARAGVTQAFSSDAERVVGLFDLTNRMVGLAGTNEPIIPQDLYDIVVIGKGTAEDRAWVFAELLRQSGFDAVILRPRPHAAGASSTGTADTKTADTKTTGTKTGDAGKSGSGLSAVASRWLVGALVDKQVYLFDPTLGWPIPSRADKVASPAVRSAATLADVLADDGLLRKLDVSADKPYPLHSDDLKSLNVEVISSSRYWLPRIRRLDSFLSGDRSSTIYAPLGDVGHRPGLLSRVIAAGTGFWKKEDVTVWDYPDRRAVAARNLDKEQADVREFHWLPFQGPVSVDFDKKVMQLNVSAGTHKEMKSRIAQLQGNCALAIRNYLLVQLEELPQTMPLSEEVQQALRAKQAQPANGPIAAQVPKLAFATNFRAAEDAKFWMGVCQLEQNMLEPAAETLDAYWRRYQEVGQWLPQAALLRGLALAQADKYALAVQQINELLHALPENDPRRPTYELFVARWRAARDAANSPKQESPAQKPPEQKSTGENSAQPNTPAKQAEPKPQAPQKASAGNPPPAATLPPAKDGASNPASSPAPTSKPSSTAADAKPKTP
jgi:hypothetical protein